MLRGVAAVYLTEDIFMATPMLLSQPNIFVIRIITHLWPSRFITGTQWFDPRCGKLFYSCFLSFISLLFFSWSSLVLLFTLINLKHLITNFKTCRNLSTSPCYWWLRSSLILYGLMFVIKYCISAVFYPLNCVQQGFFWPDFIAE